MGSYILVYKFGHAITIQKRELGILHIYYGDQAPGFKTQLSTTVAFKIQNENVQWMQLLQIVLCGLLYCEKLTKINKCT